MKAIKIIIPSRKTGLSGYDPSVLRSSIHRNMACLLHRHYLHVARLNNLNLSIFATEPVRRYTCLRPYTNYSTFSNGKTCRAICLNNDSITANLFSDFTAPLKLKCHSRCQSTAADTPDEEKSRLQRFKKIVQDFFVGFKDLLKDVRITLKIRWKLRTNHWNYNLLTRKEQWIMFKTQKNLKKTLPIVILSCIPVIGYLGPVIGFLRPRQFLSYHFWTAKQKKKFQALDDKERSVYHSIILKDIRDETKKLRKEQQGLFHELTNKMDENFHPKNDILIQSLPIFSSGVLNLEKLQRRQLQNLCSFWLLSTWLPTSSLQRMLKKEMTVVYKDDVAIRRESIDTLSNQEVEEACHVRGLNTSNASSEDLKKWLQDWVDLSGHISESETSFLAHQAIFKSVNFKHKFPEQPQ